MTREELKRITLKVIKKPRQKARLTLDENEWRFTLNITPSSLRFAGFYMDYISGTVMVDWGDGTIGPATFSYQHLTHTYAEPGIYHVSIKGKIGRIQGDGLATLTSVDSPLPKTMQTSTTSGIEYSFNGASNLLDLPERLFANCSSALSAYGCFEGCSSLLMLPEDVLKYSPNITNADRLVSGCRNFKEISEEIFRNCPKLTQVQSAFRYTDITEIPDELFSSNPLLENVLSAFYGCTQLKSIPSGLFSHTPALVTLDSTFAGCTSLTAIPGDLFHAVADGAYFGSCFEGCTGITGPVPRLWETHPNSYGYRCFRECVNASNYSSIPSNWR